MEDAVRIDLCKCAGAPRRAAGLLAQLQRSVALLAAEQLAPRLRGTVFAGPQAPAWAAEEPPRELAVPSRQVPLARCQSAPVGPLFQLDAGLLQGDAAQPPGSRSAPGTPVAAKRLPLDGPAEPPCKRPDRSGMLIRCTLCGIATSVNQLELTKEGYVHTVCGTVCEGNFVAGDGHERFHDRESDPLDKGARADAAPGPSVSWYATLRDKQAAALGGGLHGGGRRTGLAGAHSLATRDAVREGHEALLTSRQATRLRDALRHVERVLDEHSAADMELLDTAKGLAEEAFVAAAHAGRPDEVANLNSSLLALAVVKLATAQRLADSTRRKSPTFAKARSSFVSGVPEGSTASAMQVESACLLVERLLGRAAPASKAPGCKAKAAGKAKAAPAPAAETSDDDSFF